MRWRPRILHIYKDYYPPVRGGIENTINLMARGCLDEFDVSVLVCAGPSCTGEETIDGVRVVRVAEWGRVWSAPVAPAFIRALSHEARHADILHFHHPNPTGDLAYLLAGHGRPFVITYHSDIVRQRAAMLIYGFLQRFMMSRAAVIMPTSPNYMASSVWLRRFRDKCEIVPLGIEIERFSPSPAMLAQAQQIKSKIGAPIVLFVGRLRYYKGLHFLIEAMRSVEAQLVIVGSGPEEGFLHEKAAQARVEERVHFVGELDDSDVLPYFHAADVFCLPSHLRSEAFGICQIEAMACGVPVVSTALDTGVPFVNQHGETGFVVPPADPSALASALNRLLGDESLRSTFGEAAQRRAAALFSAQRMTNLVKKVYRKVLGE
ncbi:MAG: glycosyltransferase [Candidatus Sumerlaeaceae bacterium]|nr:glycosyltransferase [Candidatus Sumerlaeaceae bacterium]